MFTARPGLLDFVPVTIEAELAAVGKFLRWIALAPNARVGVRASDTAEIFRSCFGGHEPTVLIEKTLKRCGSRSPLAYDWPNDRATFGPTIVKLWHWLRLCKSPEDLIWLDPADVPWWLDATTLSLFQYAAYSSERPIAQAIDNFRRMVDRHDCTVFGRLDLPALYASVLKLCQSVFTETETPLRMVNDLWDGVPKPLAYTVYWSLRPLDFGKSKDNVVHAPLLTLWGFRPAGSRWPTSTNSPETSQEPPVPADDAAKRLHDDLWARIETLFVAARIACGLKPSEPMIARRKCAPAVLYYADAVTRPATGADYVAQFGPDLAALSRTCLLTEDITGPSGAWASVRQHLNIVRTEAVDDSAYAPLYLLLPSGDIQTEKVEPAAADLAWSLAFLEFTIAHESWLLWRKVEQFNSQWKRWTSGIEPLRQLADGALIFLHRLSRHDLARIASASGVLSSGFFSMRAALERLRDDSDLVAQTFRHDNDSTEDYIRVELKLSPVSGRSDLREGLLDAYPYHYLKQPIDDLRKKLDSPLAEVESFRLLLGDADRRQQSNAEGFGRWLAAFLAFAAILIALPQLVPSIAFDESKSGGTFLKNWQFSFPDHAPNLVLTFADIVAGGRAVVLTSFVVFILIGTMWLVRFALNQRAVPLQASALVFAFRRLVQAGVASEPIASLERPVSLDDQDSRACLALSRLYDALQIKREDSFFSRVSWRFVWPFGVRDTSARAWVEATESVLAQTQLYGFDWSNPPPLPRLACVLRYSFQYEADSLNVLALTESDFRFALERAGFSTPEIDSLKRWLERPANQQTFISTDPSGLADLLSRRGVCANPLLRTPALWSGRFGY